MPKFGRLDSQLNLHYIFLSDSWGLLFRMLARKKNIIIIIIIIIIHLSATLGYA
jgi:hypothetical protein